MTGHVYTHGDVFEFEGGGAVSGLQVAYHCSDRMYRKGDHRKVIWLCHALTASSDAEGQWWPTLVGPGKLFDTEKYFVICGNMIGSAYGSSGPASINPETGRPYFRAFPKVTVRDIVRGLDLVRQSLGINKIDLLIGTSIGGFQALEWSVMCPQLIDKAVYIATEARVTPWLTALEESQRLALEADSSFGKEEDINEGKAGLRAARTIALLSYRCAEGYNIRQGEKTEDTVFAHRAASYIRYQGEKFIRDFDAYSYLSLSYSVDSNNLGRGRGGVEKALSEIRAKATFISIDTDLLFPPSVMKPIADCVSGSDFHIIRSHFGHDGFLIETEQLDTLMRPIVETL